MRNRDQEHYQKIMARAEARRKASEEKQRRRTEVRVRELENELARMRAAQEKDNTEEGRPGTEGERNHDN